MNTAVSLAQTPNQLQMMQTATLTGYVPASHFHLKYVMLQLAVHVVIFHNTWHVHRP